VKIKLEKRLYEKGDCFEKLTSTAQTQSKKKEGSNFAS